MGSLLKGSYAEFLDSLKDAGVAITEESSVRERLAETNRWRFAFMTLAANGHSIGIRFIDCGARRNAAKIRKTFARYEFPADADSVFAANLATEL